MEQTRYNVFISYSRKDKEEVKAIVKTLTESGLSCFFDEQSIEEQDWIETLVKEIVNSTIF